MCVLDPLSLDVSLLAVSGLSLEGSQGPFRLLQKFEDRIMHLKLMIHLNEIADEEAKDDSAARDHSDV